MINLLEETYKHQEEGELAMGAKLVARIKKGSFLYEVKWNRATGDIFVNYNGVTKIQQRASDPIEAMEIAEVFLYAK